MPITLTFWGFVCLYASWRAHSSGTTIAGWNRGSPITVQQLYFVAGGLIVIGLFLLIRRHGQR
jgi:hypothetical protein